MIPIAGRIPAGVPFLWSAGEWVEVEGERDGEIIIREPSGCSRFGDLARQRVAEWMGVCSG